MQTLLTLLNPSTTMQHTLMPKKNPMILTQNTFILMETQLPLKKNTIVSLLQVKNLNMKAKVMLPFMRTGQTFGKETHITTNLLTPKVIQKTTSVITVTLTHMQGGNMRLRCSTIIIKLMIQLPKMNITAILHLQLPKPRQKSSTTVNMQTLMLPRPQQKSNITVSMQTLMLPRPWKKSTTTVIMQTLMLPKP